MRNLVVPIAFIYLNNKNFQIRQVFFLEFSINGIILYHISSLTCLIDRNNSFMVEAAFSVVLGCN